MLAHVVSMFVVLLTSAIALYKIVCCCFAKQEAQETTRNVKGAASRLPFGIKLAVRPFVAGMRCDDDVSLFLLENSSNCAPGR